MTGDRRWFGWALAGGVGFLVAAWLSRDWLLWPDFFINLSGVAFSLLAAVAIYDKYQRRQRARRWDPIRRAVLHAVSRRLFLFLDDIHWRLGPKGWVTIGARYDFSNQEPGGRSLELFTKMVGEIRSNCLTKMGGSYIASVEVQEGALVGGDDLVNIIERLFTSELHNSFRLTVLPLWPIAEECMELLEALEDFLVVASVTVQTGDAYQMGEYTTTNFMASFDNMLGKALTAYEALIRAWPVPADDGGAVAPASR